MVDYRRKLHGETPSGDGTWRYVVCAETAQRARLLARQHPDPTAAKSRCARSTGRCAVVVVWDPADRRPQRREQDPPRRLGAFDHWLDFTPELTTARPTRTA